MNQVESSLTIQARLDSFPEAKNFLEEQTEARGIQAETRLKLELVLEELLVNIIKHGQHKENPVIEIRCFQELNPEDKNTYFCLALRDQGSPFNPLEREAPLLEDDIEKRQIGGLGVFLVTQMTDRCTYAREGEHNVFHAYIRC